MAVTHRCPLGNHIYNCPEGNACNHAEGEDPPCFNCYAGASQ